MKPRLFGIVVFGLLLALGERALSNEAAAAWPTHEWSHATPEEQGLDSNALADALDFVRAKHIRLHSLQIERNGSMILDAYVFPFADGELHDLASVTKSVTSTLVGIAIGEGRFSGVDAPIVPLFRDQPKQDADPRKDSITIGHLLSMTSGLDCHADHDEVTLRRMWNSRHWAQFILDLPMAADPGSTFEYCSGGMHVLSAALTKVTGGSALEMARKTLFAPLGISADEWPADAEGISHGWGDLHLQPRDMAKLGYLWLHNGSWEGRQVVPAGYLSAAEAVHSKAPWGEEYGYGLWVYPKRELPLFEANGRGGQRVSVIPSKNMVVVMTGGGFEPGDIGAFIIKALKSDRELPPNPAGYARLRRAIADAAKPAQAHPLTALPLLARRLAGTYTLETNPLSLSLVSFRFDTPSEASLRLVFADGRVQEGAVGLDGVPRLTKLATGRTIALQGQWTPTALELNYDQVADINAFTLSFVPTADRIVVQIVQQPETGNLNAVIKGRREVLNHGQ